MPDIDYDPTASGQPFVFSTCTVKCYANYPQYPGKPYAGHRTTQEVGHDFQVTQDNAVVAPSYIWMRKHPQ